MYDTLIKRSLTKSDQVTKALCALLYAWRNKCVFNIDLKRSSDSSGIRMSSGSEFQTTGPETLRHGSFWAQSDESWTPGSRHSQVASNSRSQVSPGALFCRQRLRSWSRYADGWEASGADPSAQKWYGRTSSCSRSTWLRRWGQTAVFSQRLWHRKRYCFVAIIDTNYLI